MEVPVRSVNGFFKEYHGVCQTAVKTSWANSSASASFFRQWRQILKTKDKCREIKILSAFVSQAAIAVIKSVPFKLATSTSVPSINTFAFWAASFHIWFEFYFLLNTRSSYSES